MNLMKASVLRTTAYLVGILVVCNLPVYTFAIELESSPRDYRDSSLELLFDLEKFVGASKQVVARSPAIIPSESPPNLSGAIKDKISYVSELPELVIGPRPSIPDVKGTEALPAERVIPLPLELKPSVNATGESVPELPSTSVYSEDSNGFISGTTQESLVPPQPSGTGNIDNVVKELNPLENSGKLPLPIARVSPTDPYAGSRLQNRSVGEQGGTPFGPDSGKTTFGGNSADGSFAGIVGSSRNGSAVGAGNNPSNLPPPDLAKPPREESPEKLEALKEDMGKLAQKLDPYSGDDYQTYEKTKSLFKENDRLIRGIDEFEENFVKNARNIFVDHAWRDLDKEGKRPFEEFVLRNEPKLSFPYPTGKEPKPKTHREDSSH